MGSSVTRQGITESLENMKSAGIGGVTIFPVYGENGDENNYLDYLSPEWMEMLKHAIDETKRLGMGIDMLLGEAWPVAGPKVPLSEAAKKMYIEEIEIKENANIKDYMRPLNDKYVRDEWRDKRLAEYLEACKYTSLITLAAYDEDGNYTDISSQVDPAGFIHWGKVQKTWKVYAAFQCPTLRRQNSAAQGGEGWAVDYFNTRSVINYMKWINDAFNQAGIKRGQVRAFLNDSYEMFQENWTPDLLAEFRKRRRYDLQPYIRYLADTAYNEIRQRIIIDYCETISDLLHDGFTRNFADNSHQMGMLTINQAHNSPGNILDLYALSDMPMTENGASDFLIPGLRNKSADSTGAGKSSLFLKFASSAANVTGRKIITSESTTFLDDHFKESLSQIKPSIDELFVSGINHVFFNSMTYSPKEKPWPGRLIFWTTNYNQQSHFWNELPALTRYISKCQSVLQNSAPANDILLYFPFHDLLKEEIKKNRKVVYMQRKGLSRPEIIYMILHMLDWTNSSFGNLAHQLQNNGFTFDYISDRMITNLNVSDGILFSGNSRYKAIVMPEIDKIPLETLTKLRDLADNGATIIFEKDIPSDIPGLFDLENRKKYISSVRKEMLQNTSRIKLTIRLFDVLSEVGIHPEEMARKGIQFIRKRSGNTTCYFVVNASDKFNEGWIQLATDAKAVGIYDPVYEKHGNAIIRKGKTFGTNIYLQLKPGQSCILTCADKKMTKSDWEYLKADETNKQELRGSWFLSPSQSIDGSELPPPCTLKHLESWTKSGDKYETFSGKAIYTNTFEVPEELLHVKNFMLDLGLVRETARVRINGKEIGLAWCIPFSLIINSGIIKKENTIEIEVTNLSFNRILKMEKEGIKWKNYRRFYNSNGRFDISDEKPEDSGLISPVSLIPLHSIDLIE